MMSGYVAASTKEDSDQIELKENVKTTLEKEGSFSIAEIHPSSDGRRPSVSNLENSPSKEEMKRISRSGSQEIKTENTIYFRSELSDTEILTAHPTGVKRRMSLRIDDPTEESALSRRNRSLSLHSPQTDVQRLATEIFSAWDITGDGLLTADEIVTCSGLDQEFAKSLCRVLSSSGRPDSPGGVDKGITVETLATCLEVLMNGELEDKVLLLFKFMDVNMAGSIQYDEVSATAILVFPVDFVLSSKC